MENKTLKIRSPGEDILSQDGQAIYFGKIFTLSEADNYYNLLLHQVDWRPDEAIIFGKKITTKRKVAWYGDLPFQYTYSGINKQALGWTDVLKPLKSLISTVTGEEYNSCLLNLYHDGSEGVGWHSDAEKQLKEDAAIASVSFGAARKFSFKHKENNNRIDIILEHGSLLLMKGPVQKHWVHRLPPSTKIKEPRINLTFRYIDSNSNRN